MSLRATTAGILRATPGAWACCVMGFDGLGVELQQAPGCPADPLAWVTLVSAPLAALGRARDADLKSWAGHGGGAHADLFGAGGWDDLVVAWGGCHLVARALGAAHFVALMMGPEGLSGQGRYVLRQHHPALMAALFPPDTAP